MAVREILRMGHPVLKEKAKPVSRFGTRELAELVADMKETMEANDGAGLAAPQIGVGLRVVIFGVSANPRYPDAEEVPFTVLVNPEIEFLTAETELGWEGCLSVPGLRMMAEGSGTHRAQLFWRWTMGFNVNSKTIHDWCWWFAILTVIACGIGLLLSGTVITDWYAWAQSIGITAPLP